MTIGAIAIAICLTQSASGLGISPAITNHIWQTGGAVYSSPAIARDGNIYVAAEDGNLYAFNPDGTTNKIWSMAGDRPGKSSPVIGPDGNIYIGTTSAGRMYSFNPDGTTNLVFSIGKNMIESTPAISRDGTIYVHACDASDYLYALSPTGATNHVWTLSTTMAGGSFSSPAIAPDGTIYVGCEENGLNVLLGLNPNGTTTHVWRANSYIHSSPAVGPDGSIYVGAFTTTFFDFNPDGTTNRVWTTGAGFDSSPAIGPNGLIYVGNKAGVFFAFNTNGATNWSFAPSAAPIISSPAVTVSNVSYFAATNALVCAMDETGGVICAWQLAGEIRSSPTVASDGTVYIGTSDGNFYSLTGVGGALGNSAWPKFRQNLENTGGGLLGPQNFTATKGTVDVVNLIWSSVPSAQGYEIWSGTNNNLALAALKTTAGSTTYQDIAVSAGITNYYWIKATNVYVASPFSGSDYGYASSGASTLTVPTGVAASDGTYTDKVQVAWNSVTGATSYLIYRSLTNTTSSASLIGASISTTYDDLGATNWPGLSLFYWVKAMNSVTNSDYSASDQGYCTAVLSGSADLAASSFLFLPTTIAAGAHPDYAAFVIRNIGPDAMADATVSYYLYVSRNATYDTNAIQIGGFNDTLRLMAGENVTITLTDTDRTYLTIPADASGTYYVFVRVRAATISDPDLSNNIATRSGTITIDTGSGGPKVPISGDFDGDRKNDLALYHESSGTWSVKLSASGYAAATATLGGSGDQAIPNDFDGDGKADPAVYNEVTGNWSIMLSASGYDIATLTAFGGVGYTAVIQDFDGDGKADPGVYHEAAGSWQVKLSGISYATAVLLEFGGMGYRSAAMDYDGDGQADPAIYHEVTGNWIVKLSGSSYTPAYINGFGGTGYQVVAGMYDQDARADGAVYQAATGNWSVLLSASSYITSTLWGFGGTEYTPVVGDFDGDGKVDPALYQESTSTWFVKLSASGYATATASQ